MKHIQGTPPFSLGHPQLSVIPPLAVAIGIGAAVFGRPHHPSELSPTFAPEVAQMYKKYLDGQILYERPIDLLGSERTVAIVHTLAGAEYGFIEGNGSHQVWIVDTDRYIVYDYDADHLFVVLDASYAHSLPELDRSGSAEDAAKAGAG